MNTSEKLKTIAENVDKVYKAGRSVGGYDNGYEAGQKAEYDAFWDTFQSNGNRTNYSYGFGGDGWTKELFKPKYDMYIDDAGAMFYRSGINGDIAEICANAGVKFDTSKVSNFATFAAWSVITRFGEIDTISAWDASLNNSFYSCNNLHTIDKLILKSTGTQTFVNTLFYGCTALKNITIEGTIGKTISFVDCPLSVASMESIISHSKNYQGTSGQYTQTITFSTACWAAYNEAHPELATGWDNIQGWISMNLGWNVS